MRFRAIKIGYFLLISMIILRLGYWQILRSDDLVARAEGQRLTSSEVLAPRGDIKFSDGSLLASTQPTFLVYAQPKIMGDKANVAKVLGNIFWGLDSHPLDEDPLQKDAEIKQTQDDIYQKITQDLYWVSLGRTVNFDTKQQIEKLKLDGIGFQESYSRFYPEGSSSAHLLGFVGSDVYGNRTGYFGLEGFYNGELKGINGRFIEEKDAQGAPILIGQYLAKDPKQGKTLVLNIDRTVQHIIEDKLKEGIDKFGAKDAGAIVMDPKTGAIIAMASYPNYDPSLPGEFPKEFYKNSLIADAYEPGSTFKVLVMSAAINEGLVKPDTICDSCAGPVELGGYDIRTWDNKYFPNTTMTDVIVHSDNTGMVFVAKKLGIDKMYDYIQKFGFGQSTGIDLQDDSTPEIRPKDDWKEIDLATSSFGQGISATALQVVRAVAAIANGGRLMEPHVVSQIIDGDKTYNVQPRVVGQPISQDAANQVKEMMVQAVDRGEAQWYKKNGGVEDFKIAGKTGTAQIPVAGHYDPTKTIASFVGFAPADDPKFVIIVRYDQPTTSIYGAETAAPTFFAIARELFTYYGITPNKY